MAALVSSCGGLDPAEFGATTDVATGQEETPVGSGAPLPPTSAPDAGASTVPLVGPQPLSGRYAAQPVAVHDHDDLAFTQGLEYHDGLLLESTGNVGESDRRWVDPVTGEVTTIVANDAEHFGEGITVVGDQVIQLTWEAGVAIVADRRSLIEIDRFTYDGEGWGLCYDGSDLYMSNGTDRLTRRDPATFAPTGEISVTLNGEPVVELNELECVAGQVIANVWGADELVVINPTTGAVEAVIDALALRPPGLPIGDRDYALNGIAHNDETGRWYLTGKWWPVLYEVELIPTG